MLLSTFVGAQRALERASAKGGLAGACPSWYPLAQGRDLILRAQEPQPRCPVPARGSPVVTNGTTDCCFLQLEACNKVVGLSRLGPFYR